MNRRCFTACAAALSVTAAANAGITSITNGGIFHASPPSTIGLPNNNQANVVQGFDEVQDLVLTTPLSLFSYYTNSFVVLPAGTEISSHMVLFDPVQSASASADVSFTEPILGIIYQDLPLFNTHSLLGRSGVSYPGTNVNAYGFEATESATLVGVFTLRFSATASNPGDRFRVITFPTPGAASLLALSSLLAARRRR
ncbi:MAG: hypothetical protein DYG92_09945 [Leptolyngbya sp. PLA1]|nr:hypothetical protein [Leptolyngbya sp. PLA1]